jgi:NhaA family Na+:H+ antiporter
VLRTSAQKLRLVFSQKNTQKIFRKPAHAAGESATAQSKVFCFFSSEKKIFPPGAPIINILRGEAAGGTLLILASLAALLWSNSPAAPFYWHLLQQPIGVGGPAMTLHAAINEGLMSLFFLQVGLEIRREMTEGQLASWRGIAAPGIAALGGMAMPALIYLALNHADPRTRHGWAVPMATDIAFSLAVLRVLGRRAGLSVKVFLTALAILDDIGAILVIAVFYVRNLSFGMLAGAACAWLLLFALNRAGVRRSLPYLAGGAVLWLLVYDSGIEATLAGVALAFVVPAQRREDGSRSVARRLERGLAGWISYLVLPLFGLANAGLNVSALGPGVLLHPGPLGVLAGLFLGKQAGVFGATMLGRRLGVLRLPPQMRVGDLYGAAVLCGIGFTMSLYIADLAFGGALLNDQIKLAILCASCLSAACGLLILSTRSR